MPALRASFLLRAPLILLSCAVQLAACGDDGGPIPPPLPESPDRGPEPDSGADEPSGPCGNGYLDDGEACDPSSSSGCPSACFVGSACQQARLVGSPDDCTARCDFVTVSDAIDGDGCCPANVAAGDDSDCSACGNGRLDPWEICDDSAGQACVGECDGQDACAPVELTGSPERCNAQCEEKPVERPRDGDGCCLPGSNARIDDDCAPECGNGVVEGDEACDDGNRVDNDACTNGCAAAVCGDRIVWAGIEECDGGNDNWEDDCRECRKMFCGDGIAGRGERCDSGALNGQIGECSTNCAHTILRHDERRRLLVTAQRHPALSALPSRADAICRGEFGDRFKALVSDGVTRRGTLNPYVGDGSVDWPLQSGVVYVNAQNQHVWTTRASALLGIRDRHVADLAGAVGAQEVWYGASLSGMAADDCADWTAADAEHTARTLRFSERQLSAGSMRCNYELPILCVEQ